MSLVKFKVNLTRNRNWTDLDFMYIQYFFTPRTKGPHVLNKACNLLVIYWKTKGIPKSDNSEKRSSAQKRTESLRRKYRGQNATLPSTLDSRYEGWVLGIENIHLFATFFNEYNGNREKGKDWNGNRKGYWEAKYWHSTKSTATGAFPSMSYNHQMYLHPYRHQIKAEKKWKRFLKRLTADILWKLGPVDSAVLNHRSLVSDSAIWTNLQSPTFKWDNWHNVINIRAGE